MNMQTPIDSLLYHHWFQIDRHILVAQGLSPCIVRAPANPHWNSYGWVRGYTEGMQSRPWPLSRLALLLWDWYGFCKSLESSLLFIPSYGMHMEAQTLTMDTESDGRNLLAFRLWNPALPHVPFKICLMGIHCAPSTVAGYLVATLVESGWWQE